MTGFDLNKAMTDIDERFIEEADPCGTKTSLKAEPGTGKSRRVFRVVLIAACLVVLLAGTVVAASGVLNEKLFLDLISEENGPEELGEAYIPMKITHEGPVTVTLENIVGDDEILYCEFSTDILLPDYPNGWVDGLDLDYGFGFTSEALIPEERLEQVMTPAGLETKTPCHGTGLSPFCRDGRLWWLYSIDYTGANQDVKINDVPMRVTVTVKDANGDSDTYLFEWTNDYVSRKKTIPVSMKFDKYTLTSVDLSTTRITIYAESEDVDRGDLGANLTVDYVKLEDGSIWERLPKAGPRVKGVGGYYCDGKKVSYYWNINLIGEFRQKETGDIRVVPFEEITAISINGTEISLR
jgi:hypothetical protein